MSVITIPVLNDNYAYLMVGQSKQALIIDAPEADPIIAVLKDAQLSPAALLSTHRHGDHVQGNTGILKEWPDLKVYGFAGDKESIPGLTNPVNEGDTIEEAGLTATVLHMPCHTTGDLCYHFETEGVAFTADILFVAGCGRFFEGDATDMQRNMERLKGFPPETQIYCGHEYTVNNLKFALSVEPNNPELQRKLDRVEGQLAAGEPSVPSTIVEELATNPFMRTDSLDLIEQVRKQYPDLSDDTVEILGRVRELKDRF